MCAIAQRSVLGLLACAEVRFLGLAGRVFHRRKFRSLVRSVAKGLRFAFSAGAPPVVFALFNINGTRYFCCNFRFAHMRDLQKLRPRVGRRADCLLKNRLVTSSRPAIRNRIAGAGKLDTIAELARLRAGTRN